MTTRALSPRGLSRRQALGALPTLAGLGAGPAWAGRLVPERTLQLVAPWEVGGLSPLRSGHLFVRLQVAETLVDTDLQGRLKAGLAQAWQVSSDGLRWRFTLRPGAQFHHGQPVRAQDVVQALERARTPPGMLSGLPIAHMEAAASNVVDLHLTQPHHSLPHWLTHPTTLVLSPDSYDTKGVVQRMIATGPYEVVQYAPPQSLTLAASATWPDRDAPQAVRRVQYLAAGRAETRALMALGQQADLAHGLDPVSLARVRRDPRLQVQAITVPRTLVLKLNAAHPALNDLRVRQALSLAIDRAGMAKALLRDPAMAATQLLPPSLPDWHHPGLPVLRHDPMAARDLLRQAGWQWLGEAWQHPRHGKLQFTLRTYPDRPELPLLATALQAQWRALGVPVQVNIGNSGDIPLGHRDGTLDIALVARLYGSLPDPAGTLLNDFGLQGADWGAMGWRHLGLVRDLTELVHTQLTPSRAQALRQRVASVLHTQLPVVPVCWVRQQVVVGPRLSGMALDPLERSHRLTELRWRT